MRAPLLALLLLAPAAAGATPLAAWIVAEDTTIEGLPLVFAQDVVVMPGATLTLKAVDALVARPINLSVRAGGGLALVEGTRVAAAAPAFDVWIAPGAALLVANASFAGARLATAASAASVRDAGFAGSGVRVVGGALDAERVSLDGAPAAALTVLGGAELRLANATVGQTGDYGVRIEGGVARVENATFTLATSYAVYASGADLAVVDSTFSTHCGAFLVAGATGRIERNRFGTLDHGLTLVGAGIADVVANVFEGNAEALLVFGSAPDVRSNRFEANDVGVHVGFGSTIAPTLRSNTFVGNGVAADHDGAGTLDARHNWWGSAAGPAASDTSGAVATAPWLTGAP